MSGPSKEETGRLAERLHSGRPRLSTVRDDSAIIRLSLRHCRETVPALRASWESYGVTASLTTVRRRLQNAGLNGRKAAKKPLLTPVHRQKKIENLWYDLKCSVHDYRSRNFTELEDKLRDAWDRIPVVRCQRITRSMP
ncbi:hypothetical protein ACF0H5_009301 [Mactra antiquata]